MSKYAITRHASERYAQRVLGIHAPTDADALRARNLLRQELADGLPGRQDRERSQRDVVDTLHLKSCVAFLRDGRVVTVMHPKDWLRMSASHNAAAASEPCECQSAVKTGLVRARQMFTPSCPLCNGLGWRRVG